MLLATKQFRVYGTTTCGVEVNCTVNFILEKNSSLATGKGLVIHMQKSDGADNYFELRHDSTLRKDGSNFARWAQRFAEEYFGSELHVVSQ